MKAVVFREFGNADVLRVEELPDPTPGAGEVLVEVTASALNHLDVDVREGVSRFPIELPTRSASSLSGVSPSWAKRSRAGRSATAWPSTSSRRAAAACTAARGASRSVRRPTGS